MQKLSIVIITYNEENKIDRCIESVLKIADEIVVLDSNSTDKTVAQAEKLGARVYHQPFLGYVEQKNKALSLASNDFILSLDADELLDETLLSAIAAEKKAGLKNAYTMNRATWYYTKFIRHGSWYPERKLRLFNRRYACWEGDNPHDRIQVDKNISVSHLPGDILHYSYDDIAAHVAQNNRFSSISADSLYKRNKKAGIRHLVLNPSWAFFKSYFLRAGFLDGFYGFVIAINIAHLTFLKYSKLYQLQKEKRRDLKVV